MKVESWQMKYRLKFEGFDEVYSVFSRDIPNEEMKEEFRREFLEKNPRTTMKTPDKPSRWRKRILKELEDKEGKETGDD